MKYLPVDKSFFEGTTSQLACRLLGSYLVHEIGQATLVGRIVEVEAYLGSADPAAHTYRGMTERTLAMFGPPGHAYIYLSYGSHFCLNVSARPVGVGEGVLLRALEPIEGTELMAANRGGKAEGVLISNGPGKLFQAMGVTKDFYGHDLTQLPLYISKGEEVEEVVVGPRIGISKAKDLPLRFYIKGNPFVSRAR